jgi:hypothetical protein
MNSKTVTLILNAPKSEVFSFISNIENLPKWATEFCQELKKDGDKYKVISCNPNAGELFFSIRSDQATGVVDMFAGPTTEQMSIFPTRVVELSDNSSVYIFTMFQTPGMSDELFNTQYDSLTKEFGNIRQRFA